MAEIHGFIGICRMGGPMAPRLVNKATSAADICSTAKVALLSSPNPEIVQTVALRNGGVIEGTSVKRRKDFRPSGRARWESLPRGWARAISLLSTRRLAAALSAPTMA